MATKQTKQTKPASRRASGRVPRTRDHRHFRSPLPARQWVNIGAVAVVALGLATLIALVSPNGSVTAPVFRWMTRTFGWAAPIVPVWLMGLGGLRLMQLIWPDRPLPIARIAGGVFASVALPGAIQILPLGDQEPYRTAMELHGGGGAVGYYMALGLAESMGTLAAATVLWASVVVGVFLLFDLSFLRVGTGIWRGLVVAGRWWWRAVGVARSRLFAPRLRVNQPGTTSEPLAAKIANVVNRPKRPAPASEEESLPPEPPRRDGIWKAPSSTLFNAATAVELSQADLRGQAKVIEETLASFNIQARVVEVNSGPTVTQFGIEPGPGVAVNRILARQNDLALRLGAVALRLEAPAPGRRFVGVEVPNRAGAMVSLRELLESDEWTRLRSRLRLALGRNVSGKVVIGDLARMPHLLIAGATGSGKSVCINTIIASLIYQLTPDELEFVMIDPKMVELVGFNGIPHLRMPVVTDMDRVVGALKWVIREMERRYALFAAKSARNLEAYNKILAEEPGAKQMPFLVVVIDELADMMMTAGDEVERILCRLAQLARATGIHLVVATQRPSVDVITGLIKANFPTRISFAVSSQIDSRTILDTSGAEKLLGRGDMLFLPQDSSKPIRIQGAFVSDEEMQRLVEFWRTLGLPRYTEADVLEMEALAVEDEDDGDELYEKAVDVALQYRRVSASLLQRRLGIGYPRAARLVDMLEERGVVGPSEDGKSREVMEQQPLPEE
jgi:S-DNA-T family DNA segregation ATPase FtsK/SpoIIIE